MDTRSKIIYTVVTAALMGGSFYAGTLMNGGSATQLRQMGADGQWAGRQAGLPAQAGGQMPGQSARAKMGNLVNGEVVAKDEKTLTIKTRDNSTKNIYFTETTKIYKQAEGALADVEVGKLVMASGTANQDGSLAASDIQIRPDVGLLNGGASSTPEKVK